MEMKSGKEWADYSRAVDSFLERMRPEIEEEQRFWETLSIGTKFWLPCAGRGGQGIKTGHVGQVLTYKGNRDFDREEWITEEEARERGISITSSSGHCPECYAAVDADE